MSHRLLALVVMGTLAASQAYTADVTRAADRVRIANEGVEASAIARDLARKRLEAEEARLAVGLSTILLVVQAQRDPATAETGALRAVLDYRTALVDFDLVQMAG